MEELTEEQSLKMWYIIAIQALLELGRPLRLDKQLAWEIMEGKWQVLNDITDDGVYLYKAERREEDEICWDSRA